MPHFGELYSDYFRFASHDPAVAFQFWLLHSETMTMTLIEEITSDDILEQAFQWLCKQREHHPPNADCSGQVKIDTLVRKFFTRGVTPNPMIRHQGRWSRKTTANQRMSPTTCQGSIPAGRFAALTTLRLTQIRPVCPF